MAEFKLAHALTKVNEGGFSNNPNDRGGMTLNGIARKIFPLWKGWRTLDGIIQRVGLNPKAIDREVAKSPNLLADIEAFYKLNFWDVNNLSYIKSQDIANELFDTGVNMGTVTAAKMLQEAVNLCNKNQLSYPDISVDGKIFAVGQTINTVNIAHPVAVLNTINMLQGERYLNIMRNNKSQETFWGGWLKRVIINKW